MVLLMLYRGVTGGFDVVNLLGLQCSSPLKAALLLSWSSKLEWAERTAHLPGLPRFLVVLRLSKPPAWALAGSQALHLQG
jgi:hypothetical protein